MLCRRREGLVEPRKTGAFVRLGGVLTDLNSGIVDAIEHPRPGFMSRCLFHPSDIEDRLADVRWFHAAGRGPSSLEVTPSVVWLSSWAEALRADEQPEWEDATLEAQNQLTMWLHLNARTDYQSWNERAIRLKADLLPRLSLAWAPHEARQAWPRSFKSSLEWNILGAAMENEYLETGHPAHFFLELLTIYEAGHIPCGWEGRWPDGRLLVY